MAIPRFHCLGTLVLDRFLTVDRLPGADDKAFIKAKREAAGGPPRNVAAALAGWGNKVSLASVVGDDPIGHRLIELLAEAGIGTDAVIVAPGLETAGTFILVEASGDRAILIDPVPESMLAAIGSAIRPVASDIVLSNLFHPTAAATALRRARAAGALALVDLEWPEISRWGWDAAMAAAAEADIVATNGQVVRAVAEEEGLGLDAAIPRLADRFASGGGRICVTLGADGVFAREQGRSFRFAALPVTPVNTNGAGDRFLAGLATALAADPSFERALRHGIAAAGLYLAGTGDDWSAVETAAAGVASLMQKPDAS